MTLRTFLAVPVLVGFALLVSACSGSDDGESRGSAAKGQSCSKDLDCADSSARCSGLTHACTGPLTKASYAVSCTAQTAGVCEGYICLTPTTGGDGVCSFQCASNKDCGEGACVTLQGAGKVCLKPCDGNADCNAGYSCLQDPGGNGNVCWIAG